MNELLDVYFFYWVRTTSVEKMFDFDVSNECVTNQQTDQPTDRRTQPIIEMRGRI